MTIATPAPKPETIISSNPNSKLMTSLKVAVKKEFPKMKTMKAMKSVPKTNVEVPIFLRSKCSFVLYVASVLPSILESFVRPPPFCETTTMAPCANSSPFFPRYFATLYRNLPYDRYLRPNCCIMVRKLLLYTQSYENDIFVS